MGGVSGVPPRQPFGFDGCLTCPCGVGANPVLALALNAFPLLAFARDTVAGIWWPFPDGSASAPHRTTRSRCLLTRTPRPTLKSVTGRASSTRLARPTVGTIERGAVSARARWPRRSAHRCQESRLPRCTGAALNPFVTAKTYWGVLSREACKVPDRTLLFRSADCAERLGRNTAAVTTLDQSETSLTRITRSLGRSLG